MIYSRRQFLRRSGVGAAALAAYATIDGLMGDRFPQQLRTTQTAIAATTGRKIALLIGIDSYADPITDLRGAVADVDLQEELLRHRFGFSVDDVRCLRNQEATFSNISEVFTQGILSQTTADDTVLIHFSGYGTTLPGGIPVLLPADHHQISPDFDLNGAPEGGDRSVLDVGIPTLDSAVEPTIPAPSDNPATATNLPLEMLVKWVSDLKTKQVTVILDCGWTATTPTAIGNWIPRSFPLSSPSDNSDDRPTIQSAATSKGFVSLDRTKGNWILAATPSSVAVEGLWDGFTAGLLTYTFTQALWNSCPAATTQQLFATTQISARHALTSPEDLVLKGKGSHNEPPFSITTHTVETVNGSMVTADAVGGGMVGAIRDVTAERAKVWLGGISPALVPFMGSGSLFRAYDGQSEWVLKSRQKLIGSLELRSADPATPEARLPEPGTPLAEIARALPTLKLAIALDPGLSRIERVDATSALANASVAGKLRSVETADLAKRSVDCLFGRITDAMLETLLPIDKNLPLEVGTYGLLWPDRTPIRDTFGKPGEAPKNAIERLVPRLHHLLAGRQLRAINNSDATPLPLVLEIASSGAAGNQTWQQATLAATLQSSKPLTLLPEQLPQLAIGDHLSYTIDNRGDIPLYVQVIVRDGLGGLCALTHSPASTEPAFKIPAHARVKLSDLLGMSLAVRSPQGLTEVFLIASTTPMVASDAKLREPAKDMGLSGGFLNLPSPMPWCEAVLQDITGATTAEGSHVLDHQRYASLSTSFFCT